MPGSAQQASHKPTVERLAGLIAGVSCKTSGPIRIELEIDPIDPLRWLHAQSVSEKTYWRGRDDKLEIAGIGTADLIIPSDGGDWLTVVDRVGEQLLDTNGQMRYVGGIRFDPSVIASKIDPAWQPFGACRFVMPQFELICDDSSCRLACNLARHQLNQTLLSDIAVKARRLRVESVECSPSINTTLSRQDIPNRSQWSEVVDTATNELALNHIQKVVLARQSTFNVVGKLDPWRILDKLRDTGSNCFLFGFQPEPGVAFVCASPERLYRRSGDVIKSEAVAGTRPRGRTDAIDKQMEQALFESEKDQREHQCVVDSLRANLAKVCPDSFETERQSLLKLDHVQHLITRFRGKLTPDITDKNLLELLHPTPAVGGYPADNARAEISRLEQFDRGWYAGPVGWLSRDEAEFAVAIRSGLISNNRLKLFSGAGIVKGSTPEDEWAEIETKVENLVRALESEN